MSCCALWLLGGLVFACKDEGARQPPAQGEYLPSSEDSIRMALERQAVIDYSALVAEVRTPSAVSSGQPVSLRLVVRNTSNRPVWLEIGDSTYAFNLIVAESDGVEVWNRLQSMRNGPIPAILKTYAIAPGDSVQFQDTWDQQADHGRQVAPGTYSVRGALNTNQDRSDRFDMTAQGKILSITQ
jgi:hypothetical protein